MQKDQFAKGFAQVCRVKTETMLIISFGQKANEDGP
jgi:hypothetical protein